MTRRTALASLLTAMVGAGCSSPPATDASSAPAAPPAATPPGATVHDGRAVEITGNDTMKFDVTEIAATPGEKLSLTLVNTGTTPKFSMGHNLVVIARGIDVQAFLVASAEAVTTDYVPKEKFGASILAATRLLGPTERDTVTFVAPATPGRYEFLCSFPGHYQVGMRGVLIVQ